MGTSPDLTMSVRTGMGAAAGVVAAGTERAPSPFHRCKASVGTTMATVAVVIMIQRATPLRARLGATDASDPGKLFFMLDTPLPQRKPDFPRSSRQRLRMLCTQAHHGLALQMNF